MYDDYSDQGYDFNQNQNQSNQQNSGPEYTSEQNQTQDYQSNQQQNDSQNAPVTNQQQEKPRDKYKPVIGINMGDWIKRYRQNRNPLRLEDVSKTNYRREDSEILRTKSDIYSIITSEFTFKVSILTFNQSKDNTMIDVNHYLYISLFDNKARRNMFGATVTDIGRAYNFGCEINEIVKGNENYAQIFSNGKATNTQTLASAKVDIGICIQDFGNSFVLSIGAYNIAENKEFKRINIPINIYHVQGIALALMEYPKLKMQAIANNIHTNESLMILLNRIQDLEDIVGAKEYSNIQKRDSRKVTMQQQQVDTRNQQAIDLEEETELEEMSLISMFLGEADIDAPVDQNSISMQNKDFQSKISNELQAMKSEHVEYKAPVKAEVIKVDESEYVADIAGANDMNDFLKSALSENITDISETSSINNTFVESQEIIPEVQPEAQNENNSVENPNSYEETITEIEQPELVSSTVPDGYDHGFGIEQPELVSSTVPDESNQNVEIADAQIVEESNLVEDKSAQIIVQENVDAINAQYKENKVVESMGECDPGFGSEETYEPNQRFIDFKNTKLYNYILNNSQQSGYKFYHVNNVEILTVAVQGAIEKSVFSLISNYAVKKEIKEEAIFTIWNTDHKLLKQMCINQNQYDIELVTSVYQILKVALNSFHNKIDDAISNAITANKPDEAKELIVQRFLELTDELGLIHQDKYSINEETFKTNKYVKLFVDLFYRKI